MSSSTFAPHSASPSSQAGTLLALAPGAAPRAVHSMTHSVTMAVARETRNAMLLRWHRGESGDAT